MKILHAVLIYKLACLAVGTLAIYLGYRLFEDGFVMAAGDMHAQGKGMGLSLSQAAPGTFFALFGAVIVSVTVWKGLNLSESILPAAPSAPALANVATAAASVPAGSEFDRPLPAAMRPKRPGDFPAAAPVASAPALKTVVAASDGPDTRKQ
jgi:hypothetical protein